MLSDDVCKSVSVFGCVCITVAVAHVMVAIGFTP